MTQTFQQSVDLYKQGRADEVRAGCELIMKMDPLFDPAKRLLEKLSNPMAPIDVDALLASAGASESGAVAEARSAFESRDFRRVMELCSNILGSDPTNETAQQLGAAASEKLEAEPFVMQFVDQARNEIAASRLDAAKAAIDKARSLDEDHPAVLATLESLESARSGGGFAASFDSASAFASPDTFDSASAFDGASAFASAPPEPEPAAPAGFDFSSAFVVDSPAPAPAPAPPPTASGTPASDFGFTFEEEQKPAEPEPAAAAFDSYAMPAEAFAAPVTTAPAESTGPAEFDFATAAVDLSPDDASKIKQYLSEGDAAYNQQDFQKAIDLWSRIFLIDVTNDEASQRIELARKKRLEVDQQIDDLMVAGTLAFEKKDFPSAREKFEEVLRLDPSHFNANEYLEKLNDAQSGGGISEPPPRPSPAAPMDDLYDDYQGSEEILSPPDEAVFSTPTGKIRTSPAPSAKGKKGVPKLALIGGILALLAVIGGGAWFMLAPKGPSFDPALTQKELERAGNFANLGEFDRAIEVLKAIDPNDPMHNRALELIADFQAQKAQARDKAAKADFETRLKNAREAFANKNYLEAKSQYESASAITALPPEEQGNYQIAVQQAAKLDAAQVLFKEGKYPESIAALEQLLAEDSENVSVRLLMANAHFNMGRSLLETEQLGQAAEQFSKALEFNPQDDLALRAKDFSLRYDGQPKDLLYRIFVKYLPLR